MVVSRSADKMKTRLGASLTQVDCQPVERTWVITGREHFLTIPQREENKTIKRVSERASMCEEALSLLSSA